MARLSSMFGEIRGSIGGLTFSRNAAGPYIRQRVTPVNPNTLAQQFARASLGMASQAYHALGDVAKATWASFANVIFNPKSKINIGQFSGQNAFTSLKTVERNANTNSVSPTVNSNATIEPLWEEKFVVVPVEAPSIGASASLYDGETNPSISMFIFSLGITAAGRWSTELRFNKEVGGMTAAADFTDSNRNLIGIQCQVSEVIKQGHNFVDNPKMQSLGYTKIQDAAGGTIEGANKITFTGTDEVDVSKFKAFGGVGDMVRATLYTVTENGQSACIGSMNVVLS